MAFWDASAIVPLCCSQAGTTRGHRLLDDLGPMVVWWGTPVEARSAFARLVRGKHMTNQAHGRAAELLDRLRETWDEILPSEQLRRRAEALPDDYGLRAADAFQLGAGLTWCRERPAGRPFVCFDRRLAAAADTAGFSVHGL